MVFDGLQKLIDNSKTEDFYDLALKVFHFQAQNNLVYKSYINFLKIDSTKISNISDIPFLPIEFFKNFEVKSSEFVPEIIFESSSTTNSGVSKHFVKSKSIYKNSFCKSFNYFYKHYENYCHLALLPSYLERTNSSLVYQINHFIKHSKFSESNFFLNEFEALKNVLVQNEEKKIPTILWGVSFGLLDFVETYQLKLKYTIVIETGGMKGRRKELIREELHKKLKEGFGIENIQSEYGMTELMSQSYSLKNGRFACPLSMKVFATELNDPFSDWIVGKNGLLNIIDLNNLHSCCFIKTSDIGKVYSDGSFEVLGRMDYSETRGCNLMVL